jgi:hypothetical protein
MPVCGKDSESRVISSRPSEASDLNIACYMTGASEVPGNQYESPLNCRPDLSQAFFNLVLKSFMLGCRSRRRSFL